MFNHSLLALFFLCSFILSQTVPINETVEKHTVLVSCGVNPDYTYYSFDAAYDLGHLNSTSNTWANWASCYKISLAGVPPGYIIKSIKLKAYITQQAYTPNNFVVNIKKLANTTSLSHAATNAEPLYNTINGNNTSIGSFNYSDTLSLDIKSYITTGDYTDNYIILGAYSSTSLNNSIAKISLALVITYYLPIPITIDNNFIDNSGTGTHGNIVVDGTTRTIPSSGYSLTKNVGQNLSLSAISPQTDNSGFVRTWNTNSCGPSNWTRNDVILYYNQTYPVTITEYDYQKKYVANYAQIRTATSGTLTSNETWFTTVSLTNDIYVPTGITLTITSCATVNLINGTNHYSIISTGGTIINNGSIPDLTALLYSSSTIKGFCSSIQEGVDHWSSGQTIEIQGRTFNENISISGKTNLTIQGQTGYQTHLYGTISAYDSPGLNLSQFDCDGVYLNNCSNPIVRVDIVGSGSGNGLNAYNSSYLDILGVISNFNNGLGVTLSSGNVYSASQLTNNGLGAYATNYSNLYLYYAELCGSIDYDLYSTRGSYVYAQGCYYNNGIPRTSGYVDIAGASNCSLLKSVATIEPRNSIVETDPAFDDFKKVNKNFLELSKKVGDAIKANSKFDKDKYKNDFKDLINSYKEFIVKNPNSTFAKTSLTTAVHSYKFLEDNEGMKTFLQDIITDKNLICVSSLAKRFIIDYYIQRKDFNTAVSNANQILDEQIANKSAVPDKGLMADVLYAKALIFAHDLNQPAEAIKCLTSIINDYPVDNYVDLAENELSQLVYKVDKKEIVSKQKEAPVQPLESSNYPNPFNPTTNISFSIPQRSNVKLVVYDAIGKEVATLANGMHEAGKYNMQFNGSSLASGIYFYSLTTAQGTITKKMLLIK